MVELPRRELRQFYLPAFKDCQDAGAMMVMPSFKSLNDVPSTVNDLLMKQILRGEWEFDGMVISEPGMFDLMVGYADHFLVSKPMELQ